MVGMGEGRRSRCQAQYDYRLRLAIAADLIDGCAISSCLPTTTCSLQVVRLYSFHAAVAHCALRFRQRSALGFGNHGSWLEQDA